MSISIEQRPHQTFVQSAPVTLPDPEWLQRLNFRSSVDSSLKDAASAGDVEVFAKLLHAKLQGVQTLSKSARKSLLTRVALLCEEAAEGSELSTALLSLHLTKAERSACVEAFIAESNDDSPENRTLTDALWILLLYSDKLEQTALFSLWRWTLQRGQLWMEASPVCDAEQGLSQLRFLEVCYYLAVAFPELQGSRKLLKETTGLIRSCVDESTDGDGTPQPQWLPSLMDSLSLLARISLFAEHTGQRLWTGRFETILTGMIDRTASLCAGDHLALALQGETVQFDKLLLIAETFGVDPNSGLFLLLQSWQKGKAPTTKKISDWSLPEEVHQSDWAQLSCLRSGWSSPTDLCVVAHDAGMPQIDLVVADHPLFQGVWNHELIVDGQTVDCSADWTCSCWFADAEVNFMELIQDLDSGMKIVRQLILLREQNLLLLNHAVHAAGADEIEYRSMLPLRGNWSAELDTTTRELALRQAAQRVRVYPVTLPQERVTKAPGEVKIAGTLLTSSQRGLGERLFVSTIFDWSQKRANKPVDWNPLAIAQDGILEKPDQAVAFRCRVGREQWVMYHSLTAPNIPRTVMGLHTPHETVLCRLNSKGELDSIVEVEG